MCGCLAQDRSQGGQGAPLRGLLKFFDQQLHLRAWRHLWLQRPLSFEADSPGLQIVPRFPPIEVDFRLAALLRLFTFFLLTDIFMVLLRPEALKASS